MFLSTKAHTFVGLSVDSAIILKAVSFCFPPRGTVLGDFYCTRILNFINGDRSKFISSVNKIKLLKAHTFVEPFVDRAIILFWFWLRWFIHYLRTENEVPWYRRATQRTRTDGALHHSLRGNILLRQCDLLK